jgi:hypothetical protein
MHNPSYGPNGYVGLNLTQILENLKESVFNAGALGPEVSTGDHTILGMHLEANAMIPIQPKACSRTTSIGYAVQSATQRANPQRS